MALKLFKSLKLQKKKKMAPPWQGKPQVLYKIIGLGVLGLLTAGLFSLFLLRSATEPTQGVFWALFILSLLFLIMTGVFAFLISGKSLSWGMCAVLTLGLSFFFWGAIPAGPFLVILLVVLLLLKRADRAGRSFSTNMLVFHWLQISRFTIRKASTALVLFISIFFLAAIPIEDETVSKKIVAVIISPIEAFYEQKAPDFSVEKSTISNLLWLYIPQEYRTQLQTLPEEERKDAVEAALLELSSLIKNYTKIEFSLQPQETVLEAAHRFSVLLLQSMDPNTRSGLVAVLWVTLFVTLKTVFILINLLAIWLGFGLFKVLGLLGLYRVELETCKKEVLAL